VKVALGKHRPKTLFEITQSGRKLLAEQNEDVEMWNKVGHVGLEHLCYQTLIGKAYRELGYAVKGEAVLGERRFDVLASAGEKKVGVEVELSWNEMDNKLDNAEMVDELVVVARDTKILDLVKKEVQKRGLGKKVKVTTIAELMRELTGSIEEEDAGTNAPDGNKESEAPERNNGGTKGAES
jgi:hypothetical protein